MYRRTFIMLIGAAAGCPLPARAQQNATPVIGFLGGFNPSMSAEIELEQAAFRRGLSETGYVEGQNVQIVYARGEGHLDRLPALAADLVARKVDVIVTQGGEAASLAAKNATSIIPILFHTINDPVATGLVASLARPGSNLTPPPRPAISFRPSRPPSRPYSAMRAWLRPAAARERIARGQPSPSVLPSLARLPREQMEVACTPHPGPIRFGTRF